MGVRKKKFSVASKSMPCFVSASECGIKIDAMRLKTAFVFAFLRQNGAKHQRYFVSGAKTGPISMIKTPLTPLPQPLSLQNDIYFQNLLKPFWSVLFAGKWSLNLLGLSIPLQQHRGSKNDILFLTFWKHFFTPVPRGFEEKSKRRAETFLPTPVPQHPERKSKHRIETFSSTT